MKNEYKSYLIGTAITVLATLTYLRYSNYKSQIEEYRTPNAFFNALENIESLVTDQKINFRGPQPSQAPVTLLAIDDASLDEIGRWPWDRHTIAELIDKTMSYGVKALGLDIIFSEPQVEKDSNPDQKLAEVFEKHRGKIVLGTFGEPQAYPHPPYQDYCINEAFLRMNGSDIVKLNSSFTVDDPTELFDDLDFTAFFVSFFNILEETYRKDLLKNKFNLEFENQLSEGQKKYLELIVKKRNYEYCYSWLTPEDLFLKGDLKDQVYDLYSKLFSKSKEFKNLPVEQAIEKFKKNVFPHPLTETTYWTANISAINQASDYSSSFNAFQDPDGKVRRMPLFYRTGNKVGVSFIPSLPLQTYLAAEKYRAQVNIAQNESAKSQKEIKEFLIYDTTKEPEAFVQKIPVDLRGRLRINYYGPSYSIPHVSAREILSNRSDMEVTQTVIDSNSRKNEVVRTKVNKEAFLKGKILIMGATATAVYDLRVTPFEKNFPGPEIHAQTLANLFEHKYLTQWQNENKFLPFIIFIFGVAITIVMTHFGAITSGAFFICSLLIIVGIDALGLTQKQVNTGLCIAAGSGILIYFVVLSYKYLTEEEKKKQLKNTFSKYVSPAVVEEVLKHPENIELGGKKMNVSVFFSDVRGFTTLSEKLDPQKLSDVLNLYLTPMTNIILDNQGTLDKYIGDAIMAFFGAPISYQNHAELACRSALLNLKKLEEIKTLLKQQGIEEFDVGIGINTGDVSVGNMGSDKVRNYTVMGDAVNLASRLEGITKVYGVRTIISEFTYEKIQNKFYVREVDIVRVKGKNKPVKIYELLADIKEEIPTWLATYNEAYQLYQNRQFSEALTAFEKVLAIKNQDSVSNLYIERCQEYLQNPPPADWDGVYNLKTK